MQNHQADTDTDMPVERDAVFHRRLAETRAWCAPRVSLSDPAGCLRATSLRPSNYQPWRREEALYNGRYRWGTLNEAQETVNGLAQRRADLLRAEGVYPADMNDASGGRLVALFPEDSGDYGLTADATGYFMDDSDVFPWDTWVWCDSDSRMGDNGYMNLALFCWIPALFVPAIEAAITVDPHSCFSWVADYDYLDRSTPFLQLWTEVKAQRLGRPAPTNREDT